MVDHAGEFPLQEGHMVLLVLALLGAAVLRLDRSHCVLRRDLHVAHTVLLHYNKELIVVDHVYLLCFIRMLHSRNSLLL
jgi:hypothetical protein